MNMDILDKALDDLDNDNSNNASTDDYSDETETEYEEETEEAAEETSTEEIEADKETEENAVILAKDGKHTIPYEKLVEAREKANLYRAKVSELESKLSQLQDNQQDKQTEQFLANDNGDDFMMSPNEIKAFIKNSVNELVANRLSEVENQQAKIKAEKHFTEIFTAHPDAESIAESKELQTWIATLPKYAQSSVQNALTGGSSAEIIEILDDFKKWQQPQAEQAKIKETANAKIAKAQGKSNIPDTLSNLDGTRSGKDANEALVGISPSEALDFFSGKTLEEIDHFLNR